jgi:ATP-dependent helicase/nuclease subunit A
MQNLRNEMILASAGSGKTYRLTNRFVHLLALGVSPERIIALTFTRKAAAEFLDEILKKLSTAASNPGFATELRDQLGLENWEPSTLFFTGSWPASRPSSVSAPSSRS